MRHLLAATSLLILAGCGLNGTDRDTEAQESERAAVPVADNEADSMASNDMTADQKSAAVIPDSEPRPVMQLQVVLDRQGFGPGVIDGSQGLSTRNALKGFQEAHELDTSGELDDATGQALAQWGGIPATRLVTIPEDWVRMTFAAVPDGAAEQAKAKQLGYASLAEKLAERFHTTVAVLEELNPGGQPAGMGGAGAARPARPAARPSATPGSAGSPSPSGSASPAAPSFHAG